MNLFKIVAVTLSLSFFAQYSEANERKKNLPLNIYKRSITPLENAMAEFKELTLTKIKASSASTSELLMKELESIDVKLKQKKIRIEKKFLESKKEESISKKQARLLVKDLAKKSVTHFKTIFNGDPSDQAVQNSASEILSILEDIVIIETRVGSDEANQKMLKEMGFFSKFLFFLSSPFRGIKDVFGKFSSKDIPLEAVPEALLIAIPITVIVGIISGPIEATADLIRYQIEQPHFNELERLYWKEIKKFVLINEKPKHFISQLHAIQCNRFLQQNVHAFSAITDISNTESTNSVIPDKLKL